tara:strand:- start:1196 stop:2362 length:1167 start_codon:yes stop_codon:yes gene_type:complete
MGTIGDFRARFAAAHLKAVNEALNEVDNVEITKAIANEKKQVQFKTFLKNLAITGGNPEIEMKKILNNAGKTEAEAFAGKLYEYNTVEALKSNNSKEVGNSKFSKSLFSMDAKGIGPGELWLAWLVKDVVVSGGDKSYDITQGKLMYEVKSYTDTNSPFRLGNAGTASKFVFIRELRRIGEIADEIVKNKSVKASYPELFSAAEMITTEVKESASSRFSRAEVDGITWKNIIEFIEVANKTVGDSEEEGYNLVQFQSTGKNLKNITYMIDPKSAGETTDGKLDIKSKVDMKDVSGSTVLMRILVKHKYVRGGITELIKDINIGLETVNAKYKDIKFLVFRKGNIMNLGSGIMTIEGDSKEALISAFGSKTSAVMLITGGGVKTRERNS